MLATDDGMLRVGRRAACDAEGYRDSLARGGGPFVVGGEHGELAGLVAAVLAPGPAAWRKDLSMMSCSTVAGMTGCLTVHGRRR